IESCWESVPQKRPTAIQVAERLKPLVTTTEQKQSLAPSTLSLKEDQRELEMQKLKAEMEQMKLAHEQQLRAAVEGKQRLEAEKQQREKEMERLKQRHQAELKRSQEKTELKPPAQTIATPPKPTPTPMSQVIPQTLMPAPKPAASLKQLKLQDQLIAACKQGDEKTVTALLKQGAKPDRPNTQGEQPLGAAVWGMCPDVVNALLEEAKGIAPMTWEECERHNLEKYKEVFIIPKFEPKTSGEWYTLLQKMDPNPFIRAFHLKKVDEVWYYSDSSSWKTLNRCVKALLVVVEEMRSVAVVCSSTEVGYVGFRTQIKQGIESAKRPTAGKNF
ncbi:MAG: hypothetical protein JSR33_11920, partial [Proteobacteria bacterium]|nr:hypothetical protein [Pseudomonadota bacterium]